MVWRTIIQLVPVCGKTIEATVTNNPSVADKWVSRILEDNKAEKTILVGFNCKYNSVGLSNNKIATLQLCVGTNCLVLQLFHMPHIPRSLTNFLNDDARVTLFGIDINENASKLHREYGIIMCGGTSSSCNSNSNRNNKVDIRALAKSWFPFSTTPNSISSLKGIAYKVAGLSMRERGNNKCITNVDWEKRVLDPELIAYASVDAYASYLIPHKLLHHM